MNYLPISDNAARQIIDASSIWAEYLKALTSAQPYAGGMYWKKEAGYEYLVKTLARNRQQRLGARSAQSEKIYEEFHKHKLARGDRLDSLAAALLETQRQNRALKAGRTPEIVVALLNAVREAGLEAHFIVVGTAGATEGAANEAGWARAFCWATAWASISPVSFFTAGSPGESVASWAKAFCAPGRSPASRARSASDIRRILVSVWLCANAGCSGPIAPSRTAARTTGRDVET